MIRVEGEEDVKRFRTQLAYCKNKFIEWEQVAKHNIAHTLYVLVDKKVCIWWQL